MNALFNKLYGNIHESAFTIIELLVYSALFSIFALGIFGFVGVAYRFLMQDYQAMQRSFKNYLIMDMIYRDCLSASMNPAFWDPAHGVWYKECCDAQGAMTGSCIGWEVVKEKASTRVRRSEGVYDFVHHRWIKRSVSGVDSCLTSLSFTLQISKDQLRVIRVALNGVAQKDTYERTVVIRNRILA